MEALLLDNPVKVRVFMHDCKPLLLAHDVTQHICLSYDKELVSLQKIHLERTNNCTLSKLLSKAFLTIYFIPNIIPTSKYEKHFKALILLLYNHSALLIKPYFEIHHNGRHELCIVIIGHRKEWVLKLFFTRAITTTSILNPLLLILLPLQVPLVYFFKSYSDSVHFL